MKIDVIGNFIAGVCHRNNYIGARWDETFYSVEELIKEVKVVIGPECGSVEACLEDILPQLEWVAATHSRLSEFIAKTVFEYISPTDKPPSAYGYTSYFEMYKKVLSELHDEDNEGWVNKGRWFENMLLYAEWVEQGHCEVFNEVEYQYNYLKKVLDELRGDPLTFLEYARG